MSHTVLSVDADAAARSVRNEVLREAGFQVLEAAGAEDALRLASENQPAFVVLAIELPELGGFAVSKRLKADPRTASIPVLHIASQAESYRGYPQSIESGADAYLPEPVAPAVLTAVAAALIRACSGEAKTRMAERSAVSKVTLSALIRSMPDEIWFADTQGRFMLANPSAIREFQIGNPTLVGVEELVKSLEVFRADGSPRPVDEAPPLRALRGEMVRNQEEIVRTPVHGELRHRQVSASPVRDAAGNIIGSVSVVRDITDRKRAEQTARSSEERYRTLFEAMSEGFALDEIICDEAGKPCDLRYLAVNPAFERQTGLKAEDIIGRTTRELFPEAEPVWFERYGKVALTGEPARFEEWFGPLGRWFEVCAFQTEPGRFGVVFTDITGRKRQEEALRESEAVLRGFFDSPGVMRGIVELIDGRIVHVSSNAAAAEMYGIDRESIAGKSATEAGASEELARLWVDLYEESRRAGKPVSMEYARRGADGREHWHLTTASYLGPAHSGNPRFAYATRDLTDRKRAEDALRESEQRFRLFVEHAPAAIAMLDREMRYVAVSRRWLTDYRLGEQDLIGRSHYDVFPEVPESWKAVHRRCLAGAVEKCDEDRFPRSDGEVDWVRWEIRPWHQGDGGIGGIIIFSEQITERKRAEQALAASEGRLRALIESAAQGVVAVDAAGRILLVNARTEEMFGYTRDELVGQPLELLVPENLRAAHAAHQRQYFASPRKRPMDAGPDLRGRKKDGNSISLEVGLSFVEEGGTQLALALITDVTERKRTEERLRQAQKLESLGLLAGGVAHDFNNLLVGVIGNASLAQDMLEPDHPAAELMTEVLKTGEQAAHLTRQMLAYSGKGKFVVEPLDLATLIPEMSGLVRPSIAKKITMRLDLDPDLPAIEADRGQVQQVFMNLAINAAEAIGSGEGLITVKTGVQNVDERYVRLHPEAAELRPGEHVYLEVRDTGCGMDEATRTRIFDPFFSTKFTGRGLGLAAVGGILRGHNGAIMVSSQPGQGSCFTALFPAAERAAGKAPPAGRASPLDGAGVVLLVDDERVVREMAQRALERYGYTVLAADSGSAAIDIFGRHPGEIALVVLDLSMPHMNGEEALPELRKIRPAVKVVVSSGYSEVETMALFLGQQVSGFIQKPYTAKDLAEKVKACLG